MFAILNLNQLAKAEQIDDGTIYALCAAVMYFAVGESNASEKDFYRNIGQNFVLKGGRIMEGNKFANSYNNAKKIVNGKSDAEFNELKDNCTKIANKYLIN